jgi:hypothetical protein
VFIVGARYADRDIEDPQQVRANILGISQPLQDGIDYCPVAASSGNVSFVTAGRRREHCRSRAGTQV